MSKFRRKPVIVDAVQWFPGLEVSGVVEVDPNPEDNPNKAGMSYYPAVLTIYGEIRLSPGDWIVTDVGIGRVVYAPDSFEAQYEAIKE